jgi:hypothetical protein
MTVLLRNYESFVLCYLSGLLLYGCWGLLFQEYINWGWNGPTPLFLVVRLKVIGATPLFHHMPSWCVQGQLYLAPVFLTLQRGSLFIQTVHLYDMFVQFVSSTKCLSVLRTVLRSPSNAVCPDLIIGLKVVFYFVCGFPQSFKVNGALLP